MQKVIGLGLTTSHEGQNKGNYPTLDDFHEILEDSILIHHGEIMSIILYECVPPTETTDHV
jgi:hypothetical protein